MKNTKVKKIKEYIADHKTINNVLKGLIIGGIVVSIIGIEYILADKAYRLGEDDAINKIYEFTKEDDKNHHITVWEDSTSERLFYSFGKVVKNDLNIEVKP